MNTAKQFFDDLDIKLARESPCATLEAWLRKCGVEIPITTDLHEKHRHRAKRILSALEKAGLTIIVWRNAERMGHHAVLQTR